MNFKELESNELNGGVQYIFKSDSNDYGASIVQHNFSYGGDNGLWELAVIKYVDGDQWRICYETDITNDVLGHLSEEEVNQTIEKINEL